MPTMRDRSITLRGDIVGDERQLDGSRHLTLDLVDAADAWSCTLSLVVDRHNRLREGIVELDGPERSGSAVLDRVLDLQVEPVLTLVAEFRDTDADPIRWRLRLQQAPDAADGNDTFELTCTPSA